jgi:hypothetical protein
MRETEREEKEKRERSREGKMLVETKEAVLVL